MATSTLAAIQSKVRRLTRSQSEQLLSNAALNEYINTFLLYDFSSILKLTDLKQTYTFYTRPYQDKYETITLGFNTQPLFNYKNIEYGTFGPFYSAGFRMAFSQSREEFYGRWPFINTQAQIGTGDGVTTNFSGTLANIPVLPNNVTFSSQDGSNLQVVLADVPVVDGNNIPTNNGNLYTPNGPANPSAVVATNTINYVTGVYNITFPTAPGAGQAVYAMTFPYAQSMPNSVLFFQNAFYLRPVPDKVYPIQFEIFVRPVELINDTDIPEIEQWWQYIAYGAAIKVLQDRNDLDTVGLLMPEFHKQELLVLRRTLTQQGDDRATTIYSQQTSFSAGSWWNGFNS